MDSNLYDADKFADLNSCANCNTHFDNEAKKVTQLKLSEETGMAKVYILDALMYVYGLNISDFSKRFQDTPGPDSSCDIIQDSITNTITYDDTALCCLCCPMFSTLYGVHKMFNKMSSEDSLLQRTIKSKRRRTKDLSCIKVERDTDQETSWGNQSEGDKDQYSNLFEDETKAIDKQIPDDCKDDIFDKCQDLVNVRDMKNIVLVHENVSEDKHLVKRKRGRPRKIRGGTPHKVRGSCDVENATDKLKSVTVQRMVGLTSKTLNANYVISNCRTEDGINTSHNTSHSESLTPNTRFKLKNRMLIRSPRASSPSKLKLENSHVKSELNHSTKPNQDFISESPDTKDNRIESTGFYKIRHLEGKRKAYVCDICGEGISRIKKYHVHMNSHKKAAKREAEERKRRKFKCSQCDKLVKNEESLKNHEKIHHSREKYYCDICGRSFAKVNAFRLHQQYSHTDDKQFECKVCGMRYKWKGSLQCHELTHTNPRPHVCEKCGKSFANKSNFNRHRTYHEDEDQQNKDLFKCSECGKHLKNRKSLKKHIDAFHRLGMQKIFTCDVCGKTTKTSFNLRLHKRIHDPNRIQKRKPKSDVRNTTTIRGTNDFVKKVNVETKAPIDEPVQFVGQQPNALWC